MATVRAIPRRKFEWRRAFTALGNLIADPQRTDQVFEITEALAGNSFERMFQKFHRHPDGQRLLSERPSLLATLSDRTALWTLPPGSFGRCYAEFMQAGNLTPEGLVEADVMAEQRRPDREPIDPDREFFGDRLRDMHDLWHVLTGYGMDEAGEAANLAFTLGQVPTAGVALIVLAAGMLGPKSPTLLWQRYLYRAWKRGRRAAPLTVVPYERLLPQPLESVRRLLQIAPVDVVHPDGVIVADRGIESAQPISTH